MVTRDSSSIRRNFEIGHKAPLTYTLRGQNPVTSTAILVRPANATGRALDLVHTALFWYFILTLLNKGKPRAPFGGSHIGL